ncbi:MAG TPA: SOS response-associated peptidase [Kofleriaceae bacterium]|nr:SOS response-associated peptidase [Kofleriaceae bacterium]
MCGRYTLTDPQEAHDLLAPILDDPGLPEEVPPRFNIAPTQTLPIVANRQRRAFELARWGLVPSWAKDLSIGNRMINARAESLAERPAFRDALARRRCLVPATGFFEWQKVGKRKQPYFIHPDPLRPYAFAGLWDRWKTPEGSWLVSFTIVTCPPNELVAPLHDRMPVVVAPEDWDRWLAREALPPEALQDILAPPPAEGWVAEPVGDRVNRPDHEGPECIAPPRPVQGSLF